MKRLVAFPLLFAAGVTWGWFSGYLWPVAMQTWSAFAPRPVVPETEGDYPA